MTFLIVLIIPVIIAVVSYYFLDGITLKEFLLQIGIQLVIAAISVGIIFYSNLTYTEIWNGYVVDKTRDRVSCRHSYPCNPHPCNCDKKGCSTCWDTCYDHSYDIDWNVKDSVGNRYSIDTIDRQGLQTPPRWDVIKNGDPTASKHSYKNYIKASQHSLFHRQGQDIEKYKEFLKPYPLKIFDYYRLNRIVLAGVKLHNKVVWEHQLSLLNSRVGSSKECNAIIVLTNQTRDYFYALGQHWQGGNKNDAILFIGLDGKKIVWSDVMALVQSSLFQVQLRDDIQSLKILDMEKILKVFEENIVKNYKRKSMKEFEYLTKAINPTATQMTVTIIIGAVFAIGIAIFFHQEDVV